MTVAEMQAGMAAGTPTSVDLVNFYLTRIQTLDQHGPTVNSVLEVNPDAKAIAMAPDADRKAAPTRAPLHALPALLTDSLTPHAKIQPSTPPPPPPAPP